MSSADEVSVSATPQTAPGGEQDEGREEEGQVTVPEAEEQMTFEMVLNELWMERQAMIEEDGDDACDSAFARRQADIGAHGQAL